MYTKINLIFILIISLVSFACQDANVSFEDESASSIGQKEQNDSGVEKEKEAPNTIDSEMSGGEEQPVGEDTDEEQKPQEAKVDEQQHENEENNGTEDENDAEEQSKTNNVEKQPQMPEEMNVGESAVGDISQPPLDQANENCNEEPVKNIEEDHHMEPLEENDQSESGNDVVPYEGENNEQHPEDGWKTDSAEKKEENMSELTPTAEESSPKTEEKNEEKIEEPISEVNEAEKRENELGEDKKEDKIEKEEEKNEEEKPKVESAEQEAENNTTVTIVPPAPHNTTSNSTTPATNEKNQPGNGTETTTSRNRVQGIMFFSGGVGDESSSESDEEEKLGSAEKGYDLSLKEEEGEEKPSTLAPVAANENKEKGTKIKVGATMMHSEMGSDGIRRSNVTKIDAEMAN